MSKLSIQSSLYGAALLHTPTKSEKRIALFETHTHTHHMPWDRERRANSIAIHDAPLIGWWHRFYDLFIKLYYLHLHAFTLTHAHHFGKTNDNYFCLHSLIFIFRMCFGLWSVFISTSCAKLKHKIHQNHSRSINIRVNKKRVKTAFNPVQSVATNVTERCVNQKCKQS